MNVKIYEKHKVNNYMVEDENPVQEWNDFEIQQITKVFIYGKHENTPIAIRLNHSKYNYYFVEE